MAERCIIFDLDGTLVDSEALCNQAFLDLLPALDDSVERLVHRYRGRKLAPILADIEHRLGHRLPEDFERRYRQRVSELFTTDLRPTPGVLEMLESLRHPYCVASSGPREKIQQALNVSGLAPFFRDTIFSSYEVGSWKPEPGLFLHAAGVMDFSPGECVVVEDSEVGIMAAAAAGMTALQYIPDGALPVSAVVKTFSSMSELPALLKEYDGSDR
jgi:HAD superfamily hydrolase (TIGR01509 family)